MFSNCYRSILSNKEVGNFKWIIDFLELFFKLKTKKNGLEI